MPRLNRTKGRIAELEARIHANSEGADRQQELRFLADHFKKLAVHLRPGLENANWNRRREISRSLVERIEIARTSISIVYLAQLPRPVRRFGAKTRASIEEPVCSQRGQGGLA